MVRSTEKSGKGVEKRAGRPVVARNVRNRNRAATPRGIGGAMPGCVPAPFGASGRPVSRREQEALGGFRQAA